MKLDGSGGVLMDFSLPYTEEQESFRQEVRSWLENNIPEEMKEPVDGREFTKEQYLFWRAKHKELAAKGWLYPTYPRNMVEVVFQVTTRQL